MRSSSGCAGECHLPASQRSRSCCACLGTVFASVSTAIAATVRVTGVLRVRFAGKHSQQTREGPDDFAADFGEVRPAFWPLAADRSMADHA